MSTYAARPFVRAPRRVLVDTLPGARARDLTVVLAGAGLTGLAAQVSIPTPLSPVPFTLQTLAVLVVGAAVGPLRAAAAMLVYLAAGSAGVPWFAGHTSGWSGNPSFGYVVGFVLAGTVLGWLASRGGDRHVLSTLGLMLIGEVVIFGVGTTWLALDLHLSATQAVALGVTPFVLTEAVKLAAAGVLMPTAWRLADRW